MPKSGEDSLKNDKHENLWFANLFKYFSFALICLSFPFSLLYCLHVVAEYERAVIFRMGRILSAEGCKGPGLFFIIPCIDTVRKIDLRTLTFAVPPQEVLTRDSVTVSVDAVVFYKVFNPTVSVTNVEDADMSTRLLAQTTLRNVLGTKDLAEILSDRDAISNMMQETLDAATEAWGVKVERVEIKDVRLPTSLQRVMAAEAEATREARSKVIAATGELNASRALKQASDVLLESTAAMQLRYLQTLNTIAAEKDSTIIFPVPIDMFSHFSPDTSSDYSSDDGKHYFNHVKDLKSQDEKKHKKIKNNSGDMTNSNNNKDSSPLLQNQKLIVIDEEEDSLIV